MLQLPPICEQLLALKGAVSKLKKVLYRRARSECSECVTPWLVEEIHANTGILLFKNALPTIIVMKTAYQLSPEKCQEIQQKALSELAMKVRLVEARVLASCLGLFEESVKLHGMHNVLEKAEAKEMSSLLQTITGFCVEVSSLLGAEPAHPEPTSAVTPPVVGGGGVASLLGGVVSFVGSVLSWPLYAVGLWSSPPSPASLLLEHECLDAIKLLAGSIGPFEALGPDDAALGRVWSLEELQVVESHLDSLQSLCTGVEA